MSTVAAELATIADSDQRLSARMRMKEEALLFRRRSRRYQTGGKLADALAKLGGGSLLTATLLLIVGGQAVSAIIFTATMTWCCSLQAPFLWRIAIYGRRSVIPRPNGSKRC